MSTVTPRAGFGPGDVLWKVWKSLDVRRIDWLSFLALWRVSLVSVRMTMSLVELHMAEVRASMKLPMTLRVETWMGRVFVGTEVSVFSELVLLGVCGVCEFVRCAG